MDALLAEFQKFWRRHADTWEVKADYTEAFPHLLLMGFLQRIINGGGMIDREYAAGRGRVDLGIHFGGRTNIVEIKLVHEADGRETTLAEGLDQIARYANTMAADTRHLVIFDRRPEARAKPWDARLSRETRTSPDGQPVTVVWC
jgi:RecB family endonuclease NucS